jgi:predicted transcriptional regulator
VITPAQIRAARAFLDWKQTDLAKAAGISEIALKNIERGKTDPRMSTIAAIEKAFDEAGLVFLRPGDIRAGGAGVRLK